MRREEVIKRSVVPFDGTFRKFIPWVESVRSQFESLELTPEEALRMLVHYTTGAPQKVVSRIATRCRAPVTVQSVDKVWADLVGRYGGTDFIAKDLKNQLKNYPKVKGTDMAQQLYESVNPNRIVEDNMEESDQLNCRNSEEGISGIVAKLPNKVKSKWKSYGQKYEDRNNRKHPQSGWKTEAW